MRSGAEYDQSPFPKTPHSPEGSREDSTLRAARLSITVPMTASFRSTLSSPPATQGQEPALRAAAFPNTGAALQAILGMLADFVPLSAWMVGRLDGDDWTVVRSIDDTYGSRPGRTLKWSDTCCSRMVAGQGPHFAENAQAIPAYRDAEVNQQVDQPIGAYIGIPVYYEGEVVGTLCGMDASPQPVLSDAQKRMVTTVAQTLSTLLITLRQAQDARREALRQRSVAETDALTGLYNRRGWDKALREGEVAMRDVAENALVLVVDLDDLKRINDQEGHEAGDRYLQRAAQCIRAQFRDPDVVARTGGDEFGVLVRGCTFSEAVVLESRLRDALAREKISASVGAALRLNHEHLAGAVAAADAAMYLDKASRK